MTKLARRVRGTPLEKNLIRNFWLALGRLNSQERNYLLEKILTPTEKSMIAKRLATLKELQKGGSYVEITDKFKVVSNTIWRMSDLLRDSPKLAKLLGKIDLFPATKQGVGKKEGSGGEKPRSRRTKRKTSRPERGLPRKLHPQKTWFT